MDQAAAIRRIRTILAAVSGIAVAYSTADNDDDRIPPGFTLSEGAAAMVFKGATLERVAINGWQRHTYEVRVQVLVAGGDSGIAAAEAAALVDPVQTALLANVGSASGLWNSMVMTREAQAETFEFGGYEYEGFELFLRVSEAGAATIAVGV